MREDEPRRGRADRDARVSRRSFLRLAAGGAALAVGGRAVANAYTFDVHTTTRLLGRPLAPLRVALLCDLHYGPYIRAASVDAWVDATLAGRPDLVLIAGDLVDRAVGADVRALVARLARLRAPLGVFATWGNHDHSSRLDLERFAAELATAGIEVLTNRGRVVGGLYLAGIDDWRAGRPDVSAALADRPADLPCLLVSHNPDALPHVPTDVDLTVAGHTHGGQVCPPGIGPLYTSSAYGRRFAEGWVRGPALGYVSRGLGVGWLPVRVGCPAELTLIDLEGQDNERGSTTG